MADGPISGIIAGSTADSGSRTAATLTYSQHIKKVDVVSSGVRMAMSPQQFCLRWNNHQSNIISVFEQLLQTESFVDVTLAVEGMSLKAHKVVLSACSPYFQAVLASHPDKHPIVILKDVRYTDMRDLLDFMYRGEVSVDQDNLSGFLRVAESLRIKGLTEVNEKKRLENSSQAAYLLPHAMSGAATIAPGVVPMAPQTPLAGDPPPLKRPPHSPTATYCAKRRRGRPPKISGEESDCEVGSMAGSLSAAEGDDTRSEADVKVELDELREAQHHNDTEETNHREHPETKSGESTPGPSGESKDPTTRQTSVEEIPEAPRESPGSGYSIIHHPEWAPTPEYDTDDSQPVALLTANKMQSHIPPPGHLPPHSVTETMDQLYYTKNLLEAAMLKDPYDALNLKNNKHLHGSILLASLRAPLKFGLHGPYENNGDRDLIIDSSPHSPHPSPQKPTQSSPTSNSPTNGNTNGSNSKVSVPIMSYCIQDNGFKCSKCFQTFTHPSNFHRHYITVHTDRRAHKCHVCGKEFKRKDNMMSHIRSVHRPGKEGHSIFREMSAVKMEMSALSPGVKMEMSALSPSLPRDIPPLQDRLQEQMMAQHHHHQESQPLSLSLVDKA